MTSKVGPKGQVVIPKPIRDRLGLRPGDSVVFVPEEGGVRVEPANEVEDLAGRFAGLRLTEELEEDHREEIRRRR